MKSIKFIVAISGVLLLGMAQAIACGPYYPDSPKEIFIYRVCTPDLPNQWHKGGRFQDAEKEQNCLLWQKITSRSIPLRDIEKVVYDSKLSQLQDLAGNHFKGNKFAEWLAKPEHSDDYEYLLTAKEIEELRTFMNDAWYYPYEGDPEHLRLDELRNKCEEYDGTRHADRYALQTVRLNFADKKYDDCIDLWESRISRMPQNIVTDMIASYVGGAYFRRGDRDKAIEMYTRSGDIGSLISLKAWNDAENQSEYSDERIRELEYIFNRFPDSPLLAVNLQKFEIEDLRNPNDPINEDDWSANAQRKEANFSRELRRFAINAANSPRGNQKAMWYYTVAMLDLNAGNIASAREYVARAERADGSELIKDSVHALRFLLDSRTAEVGPAYYSNLMKELKWLDERMSQGVDVPTVKDRLNYRTGIYEWDYSNKMNWGFYYWQDVARRVLLGEVCPKVTAAGNTLLALQLANYASNRIHQLSPLTREMHVGWNDPNDREYYYVYMTIDEFREKWPGFNFYDYSNQFFDMFKDVKADVAAEYARRITSPKNDLDRFLNERSYVDKDYINDVVGTLYLREMNYSEAEKWLTDVSEAYQTRTNLAKDGYFKLDPFKVQFDKKQHIADSSNYKLRFAREMNRLQNSIASANDPNAKADDMLRYATGLRNSFGRCWYLTQYYYGNLDLDIDDLSAPSIYREGFIRNEWAQKAYARVDDMMAEALASYTDDERAANAQLQMLNFKTIVDRYPNTRTAAYVRGRCDNYHDYALDKR